MPDEARMRAVDAAVAAVAAGQMVVVTDDDDRENEGDLIMAAAAATPEQVAFMIRHTSGILCVPLGREDARRLNLPPMVQANDAPLGTAFTVSVDYRHGLTTGISAEERCNTARALANPNSGAADFVRPGHMFPLIAQEGGVLVRTGHTEAAVDLARLAGLPAVGLLAELVNDDGTVMRGPEVAGFARRHGLAMTSIADLIAWRQRRERLVERAGEFTVETRIGNARAVAYATPYDELQHLALVFGDLGDGEDVLARLHREDVVGDVFAGTQVLDRTLDRFEATGRGVLIYLREGAAGVAVPGLAARARKEAPTNSEALRERQWREVGIGAQILKDLGVASIRLLTTRATQYVGLAGFGIAIRGTELVAA